MKASFQEVRTAVANLNSFVQALTGMNVVQIFNNEEREFRKFKAINQEHTRANVKSVLTQYFPVAEVLAAIGTPVLHCTRPRGRLRARFPGALIAFISI